MQEDLTSWRCFLRPQGSTLECIKFRAPNAQWPLKFEKLSGTEECDPQFQDEMLEAMDPQADISYEANSLKMQEANLYSQVHTSPKCTKLLFSLLKLNDISIDDDAAAAQARQALEICEICHEAYIILDLRDANTYEEALEHFKKAMEQGT